MDATIVIPTKNGGEQLDAVLNMVFNQKTKYTYEVICVDSGSSDNTIDIIKKYDCKLYCIEPHEFGHGRTRNFGASKGTGEFILFLTQDALPYDSSWLQNFIDAMKIDDGIAGGFGKHYPYPDCNELDKRNLTNHFENFGGLDNRVFELEDRYKYENDISYVHYLGFFSDNNSCLRRSIWEKHPYKDVNFAEDQIWAKEIIEAGYKKVYCGRAAVYHSHNYDLKTYFQRYYDEYKGLFNVYDWIMFSKLIDAIKIIILLNRNDKKYISSNDKIEDKAYWKKYATTRNRYQCLASYLAGKYMNMPKSMQQWLDSRISQQYKQINDKEIGKAKKMGNWKDIIKWIFINPNGGKSISNRHKISPTKGYDYIIDKGNKTKFSLNDYKTNKDSSITLNWVIPEPGIGGGGHTTIFRFIKGLESLGIKNKVYLLNPGKFSSDDQLAQFLEQYYALPYGFVEVHIDYHQMKYAHGIVATSWETAYIVRRFDNVISKFYFVQDFEPHFYAVGSEYHFAERTYHFGFRGITAGYWLKDKLREEYGMKTEGFGFSYDDKVYKPAEKKDDVNRIFFYTRSFTARRAFEFGIMVLNEVSKRVPDLEVVFAGEDVSKYRIDFKHVNSGIVSVEQLAAIYPQCDMCLVLSTTNLSLLPLEVMASNSVCVATKGANSEWLVNEDNSIMIDFDVNDAVDKIVYYFEHKDELVEKRRKGLEFAKTTDWNVEIKKIFDNINECIREDESELLERMALDNNE